MVKRLDTIGLGGAQHAVHNLMELLGGCGVQACFTQLQNSLTSHLLLPSTLRRLLFKDYPLQAAKLLGARRELVQNFWGQFFERPANRQWAEHHPVLRGKDLEELSTMVPLAVHQDAAPCSKTKSFNCKSFSSLLGDGDEKATKLLCCSCIKKALLEPRMGPGT